MRNFGASCDGKAVDLRALIEMGAELGSIIIPRSYMARRCGRIALVPIDIKAHGGLWIDGVLVGAKWWRRGNGNRRDLYVFEQWSSQVRLAA